MTFVLITGATGNQGGAVARSLVAAGTEARALVRDPQSERAQALAAQGVRLAPGDLEDTESLVRALDGASGVFSVQTPGLSDTAGETEVRHACNLADAIRTVGVGHVVHTSTSGVDGPPVDEARWGAFPGAYRDAKLAAEQAMKDAGAERWTILRPALFMENFVRPSFYFGDPARPDHLLVALDLDVVQGWVALSDIGDAAGAAFADGSRFGGVELELAGDRRTFREVAAAVSDASGVPITLPESPAQARADGVPEHLARYQEFVSNHPYPAQPATARALGLDPMTVEQWAAKAPLLTRAT